MTTALALFPPGSCFNKSNWYFTTIIGMTVKANPQRRPDLIAIGRRIREIRGFELTQAQFAKRLGIGQQQLSNYENGRSAPTLEILVKLQSLSGKSLDWIVDGR